MSQEERIKELKNISIAYKCALEYDNCPGEETADEILGNLLDHDREELINILKKYQGWSCTDIESETFRKVDTL